MKITFEYEFIPTIEEVIKKVKEMEGHHTQQVVFSSFHHCLTQIDWTDRKIRSNKKITISEAKSCITENGGKL